MFEFKGWYTGETKHILFVHHHPSNDLSYKWYIVKKIGLKWLVKI